MNTKAQWKAMLAGRGIQVWVSEKVERIARGVVVDSIVDRVLHCRDESLRLFEAGNPEASYWAARTMEAHAVELDNAVAEQKETQAGRKQVSKAKEQGQERREICGAEHAEWQRQADARWKEPQHKSKSASDIAKLIDSSRWNTIRKHIKRPAK